MSRELFGKMSSGSPFDPFAEEWNRAMDAAQQMRSGLPSGFGAPDVVEAENTTGSVLLRGEVAGIAGAIFTPTENEDLFFTNLTLSLDIADFGTNYGRFLIAAHPVGNNEIGLFYSGGYVPALVDISAAWHGWCDCPEIMGTVLESKPHGSAEIIWSEAATGVGLRCIIRPGPRRNCHVWGKPTGSIAPGVTMTLDPWVNGIATGDLIPNVDTARLHTKTPNILSTHWCRIEWDCIDHQWNLTNAVCP